MAVKGKKFKHYEDTTKVEAIRLHVEEGWSYQKIADHLNINDKNRVKIWVRKYRQLGEYGLLDQRGRREEYIDQDRYVQKLKLDNQMLKKCLEIWMREVQKRNIVSLKQQQNPSLLLNS
ncbi:transposase [Paenibacillus sp. TAF43_2]|uniref:transposase n=1 Tax=Paenibacillus sp. TAF43_2 TaxID=3233069 RepID=UPI003F9C198E